MAEWKSIVLWQGTVANCADEEAYESDWPIACFNLEYEIILEPSSDDFGVLTLKKGAKLPAKPGQKFRLKFEWVEE